MDSMEKLAKAFRDTSELVWTENGARSYTSASIKNNVLRLFYEVSATHKQIVDTYKDVGSLTKRWGLFQTEWRKRFVRVYKQSDEATQKLLLRLLVMIRDPRKGMGERAMFRGVLYDLYRDKLINPLHLASVIAEHGRWDDLISVFVKVKEGRRFIAKLIVIQLNEDVKNMEAGNPVSLLAKWMPKENTSSKQTRRAAHLFIREFGVSPRRYRKVISSLRRHINLVESDMSANRWGEIDYEKVPSLALVKYRNAFIEHDRDRFDEYLDDVLEGRKKINASVSSPAQLIAKIRQALLRLKYNASWGSSLELEAVVAQWNSLPTLNLAKPMLPICDVSGSMFTDAGGGADCVDVAIALSILLSQTNTGPFKDVILTFSSDPQIVDMSGLTITEKVAKLIDSEWGNSTNIGSALRLILQMAQKANYPKGSILPDLVVFSDMEFDAEESDYSETVFETLRREYEDAGYEFPKVYFWNISSNGRALLPLKESENGVIELSGYSQHLFKLLTSETRDAFVVLAEELSAPTWDDAEKLWKPLTSPKKSV